MMGKWKRSVDGNGLCGMVIKQKGLSRVGVEESRKALDRVEGEWINGYWQ